MAVQLQDHLLSIYLDMSLALDILEARFRQIQNIGTYKYERRKRKVREAKRIKEQQKQDAMKYVTDNGEGTLRFG
jgi:hypothetical protein